MSRRPGPANSVADRGSRTLASRVDAPPTHVTRDRRRLPRQSRHALVAGPRPEDDLRRLDGPPRLAVELDGAGHHSRLRAEDVLHELRPVREVPELRLQLGRRDPLHVVQGVLPGRLGAGAEVRRGWAVAGLGRVDQCGGREHAVPRVAVPARALRPALLPRGVQQGQPRHLPARLLRLPVVAAVDRRGLGPAVVLDPEAHLGTADPVPRRPVEGGRRQRDPGQPGPEVVHLDHRGRHRHHDRSVVDEPVHGARRRQGGRVPLRRDRRYRRCPDRRDGAKPREGNDQAGRGGEGDQHLGRSACEGPHAAAVRGAPRTQRRADPQDPRHRLLYLAGGDEEVQPAERTARRRGRAVGGRGAVADRRPVSRRAAARVVDAGAVAPVSRRPDRHLHPPGVPVLMERRAGLSEPVRRGAHLVHGGGRPRARHPGDGHPARCFQPDLSVAARRRRGDGDLLRPRSCRGGGNRRVDRTRGAGAGIGAIRQRRPGTVPAGAALGRVQSVSRPREGWRERSHLAECHPDVAREQPSLGHGRPQRRHRVDLRQGREARAAQRAGDAGASRQPVAAVAGVGSAVRHGAGAGARVPLEADDPDRRTRSGPGGAGDHQTCRRVDLRPARPGHRRGGPR